MVTNGGKVLDDLDYDLHDSERRLRNVQILFNSSTMVTNGGKFLDDAIRALISIK